MSRGPVPDRLTQCLGIRTRPGNSKSKGPVPDPEPTIGLSRVREYIVSYYTAVISGLFSQYFDEIFRSATAQSFSCCFSHLFRISQKPLCSLYIT